MPSRVIAIFCVTVCSASAQVTVYEGSVFPESEGWERILFCTPERELREGVFVQHVEPGGECGEPPAGDQDGYFRDIDGFDGVPTFFIEWRMEADGDRSEIPYGGPSAFAAGSLGPVNYTFFIARDQAKLNRDNRLPIIFVDIAPGMPHAHRLELIGDELFVWYIDGRVVASGVPEGQYPSHHPRITWQARAAFKESTVKWDYVRFGVIPEDASGDFDSDDDVDLFDYYYVQECFSNSGPGLDAGPGCRFADFDDDTDVDLKDMATFQTRYTGPGG